MPESTAGDTRENRAFTVSLRALGEQQPSSEASEGAAAAATANEDDEKEEDPAAPALGGRQAKEHAALSLR